MRLWRRRPREVDLHLPMLRIEHLFEDPHLDPFAPELDGYESRPGLELMVGAVQRATRRAPVSVTVEVPPEHWSPDLQARARGALSRECRRRLARVEDDLDGVRRLGWPALLWGLLAVIVINALVGALGDPEPGTVEDALSSGLQVAAWVALWFPINLLVYDRWYYRRDQRAYRALRDLPLTVVPSPPPAGGTRSGP
jgi:hypothetical protein